MSNTIHIREMTPADRFAVAELIFHSTNAWYRAAGRPDIFHGDPQSTALFFDVYQALPGSGGIVALEGGNRQLAGSCFYHIRPTHISLGIMNVHPEYFGQKTAVALLEHIIQIADNQAKPLRLVSSAMNLDSYSLYTKNGFVPRAVYQDMFLHVPGGGLSFLPPMLSEVRPAVLDDIPAITDLELSVTHIRRDSDYRHFIEQPDDIWHVSVIDDPTGGLAGVLCSSSHPTCNMLGPGVAKTESHALALITAELNEHKGKTPVFLVPADCRELVSQMYAIGARNCELHFTQVRGTWPGIDGINMPTFLPETG